MYNLLKQGKIAATIKKSMKRKSHRKLKNISKFIFLLALCGLILGLAAPAAAQDEQPAWWLLPSPPDTSQFPLIQLHLEIYDTAGNSIPDLKKEEISILENGVELPLEELQRIEPGVQIIVAANNAPSLANFVGGATLFDRLRIALRDWASRQPAGTPDDFSIASNSGLLAVRLQDPQQWVKAIEDFVPNLRESQPSVISFSQALELATDPNKNPRMKRSILYITTVPTAAEQEALPNLAERAAQLGVQVNVWLVATAGVVNTPQVQPLQQMAAITGGQFFLFTGREELPNLDVYLEPIRYQYQLGYTSQIIQSGSQNLTVRMQRGDLTASSDGLEFSLTVLPPNPIFLSPPVDILRNWTVSEGQPDEEALLQPLVVSIPILIEFPDGLPRPVRRTQLLVDGVVQVENTQPPFDIFFWSLAPYAESQRVMIQAHIEDSLGLENVSIETAVQISIVPKQMSFIEKLATRRWPVILAIVVLAALILLSVLYLARRRLATKKRREERRAYRDPLTQPVPIRQEEPAQPMQQTPTVEPARDKISWAISKLKAPARLMQLDAEGNPVRGSTIPLDKDQITFGKDAKQVTCLLDSASVSGIHARFFRSADGQYMLADAGSVAGTWINYVPAPLEGLPLQHGDVVHFGKMAFRFELSNPPKQTRLKVVSDDEKP